METLRKLLRTEPAVLKGGVTTVVAILLIWGLDYTSIGEQVNKTIDLVVTGLFPLLGALWIRGSVFSPATAEAMVSEAVLRERNSDQP